ncbi:GNAT family N-acetyltransferase [Paraburkholderia sp. BR14262]|uniref:GNAT family N-acetyltransferase n=1 Tax=Paraburkholderia sp. BR14262 TaxID=3236999 RepID=UPI0034CD4959
MSDPNLNSVITYRAFTADDLAAAHALSTAVRWRHRPEDWRFAARIGEGIVAVDESGSLVGTAFSWLFGPNAATLGMLIVKPSHQRRGIGRAMIEHWMQALASRTLLLHASDTGWPLVERLGFTRIGRIHQHQGAAFQPPLVSLPAGERLRPIGASDRPRLIELATRASGLDRSDMLPKLLDQASGIALARDGDLIGFALFRRFGDGHVIGPVIAPDSPDACRAKALISHWLASNAGMFVRIDTPVDLGLSDWLEGVGLPLVDHIEKTERGAPLRVDTQFKQFAITSQAVW